MIIYPAIDLLDGACVRLLRGNYDDVTVYDKHPENMAVRWKNAGAQRLHVVDLNGARVGKIINKDAIRAITKSFDGTVQFGGGIRNMDAVNEAFELGITRVILGSAAVTDPDFVKAAVNAFPGRIVVGIDAKNGIAMTQGWEQSSGCSAIELAKSMADIGVGTIIYTDIDTDGTLAGPNIPAMCEMVDKTGLEIIASGGVGTQAHIDALSTTGVSGVIVGKALYEGTVKL